MIAERAFLAGKFLVRCLRSNSRPSNGNLMTIATTGPAPEGNFRPDGAVSNVVEKIVLCPCPDIKMKTESYTPPTFAMQWELTNRLAIRLVIHWSSRVLVSVAQYDEYKIIQKI